MAYQMKRRCGRGSAEARIGIVVLMLMLTTLGSSQAVGKNHILSGSVDEKTGVRFFYQHDIKDHFYPPLIFRVVAPDDRRRDTAPLGPEGRFVSVTATEMHDLIERLLQLHISWKETHMTEAFGPSYKARGVGFLDITVVSPNGTARGGVGSGDVCKALGSLDSAIKTPRALWEFQMYRWFDDCTIPGFDPKKYPDHWE